MQVILTMPHSITFVQLMHNALLKHKLIQIHWVFFSLSIKCKMYIFPLFFSKKKMYIIVMTIFIFKLIEILCVFQLKIQKTYSSMGQQSYTSTASNAGPTNSVAKLAVLHGSSHAPQTFLRAPALPSSSFSSRPRRSAADVFIRPTGLRAQ